MKYILELTEKQAALVASALDLYARIGIGQLEEVIDPHRDRVQPEMIDKARAALDHAKYLLTGHQSNASFGIHNPAVDDKFRAAYDIRCVIRHRLAWDRTPEGGFGVDFDTPRGISLQSLPAIKKEAE